MDEATFKHAIADGTWDWNDVYEGTAHDHEPPDPLVLETVLALPPGRALDVGCGAGGLLLALAEAGWEVTGIDVAAKAIKAAKSLFDRTELSAELCAADATIWKPPASYDVVTNCFALPMTKDEQAAALAMMRDAVAPGGTIVVKDFDPGMIEVTGLSTVHHPTLEELVARFEGFEILQAEVVDTPPHDHGGHGTHAHQTWTAAFVVARRPA